MPLLRQARSSRTDTVSDYSDQNLIVTTSYEYANPAATRFYPALRQEICLRPVIATRIAASPH
jgi:hypothetical protein